MRILFAASVVAAAFAVYACSSEPTAEPMDTPDASQDAPVMVQDGAVEDASSDAADSAPDAPVSADAGCIRNPIADSTCSSQSRQAYLCPGDAGPGDAGPVCDFFTGLGEQSLYCCE